MRRNFIEIGLHFDYNNYYYYYLFSRIIFIFAFAFDSKLTKKTTTIDELTIAITLSFFVSFVSLPQLELIFSVSKSLYQPNIKTMKGLAIEECFNYYMNDADGDERRQEAVELDDIYHDYVNNNDDESMESIERMYNKFRRRYLNNNSSSNRNSDCQRGKQLNRRQNCSQLIWIPGYGLIRSWIAHNLFQFFTFQKKKIQQQISNYIIINTQTNKNTQNKRNIYYR